MHFHTDLFVKNKLFFLLIKYNKIWILTGRFHKRNHYQNEGDYEKQHFDRLTC